LRSGSTLTAALFLGFKRDEAARFSFLLGLPAIALLLGNSRGAIVIAQREPPCRIGCCYRGWPIIVNLARGAFSRTAPHTGYVQVMHKREEPGAEIRTALPAMLLCNRADEGVLDEIVGPGHVVGQGQPKGR
jgi:hypothetical protein